MAVWICVPSSRASASPIDEASMAQAPRPCAKNWANARCNRTGSGVVMPVEASAGGTPIPKVPTSAHWSCPERSSFDSAFSAPASHQAVLVLPLVPVTASTFSCCVGCANHSAAMGPVAALRPGSAAMWSPSKAKASTPACSTRQAVAPRTMASATCARPSVAAPGQAMKPSPGVTWRLSVCRVPVTRVRNHCTASPAVCRVWSGAGITATPPPHWPQSAA